MGGLRKRAPRMLVVASAAIAGAAGAAPYALSLSITREAVSNWTENQTLVAVIVTLSTALMTGALTWIATSARTAKRAAWLCALAPLFGALNTGLALGVVMVFSDRIGTGGGVVGAFFGGALMGTLFGVFFGAPLGLVYGAALAFLAHRVVTIRDSRAHDTLERTARVSGGWLALCGGIAAALSSMTSELGMVAYAFPAIACGVLLYLAAVLKSGARARWLRKVSAGEINGWRIVDADKRAEHGLPLFDANNSVCDGMLVRVSQFAPTYREAPEQEEPVALVRKEL